MATHLRTELALDALQIAIRQRNRENADPSQRRGQHVVGFPGICGGFIRSFSADQQGHALPSFASEKHLAGHQERPQRFPTSFLNRASQVRVLPGAPGDWRGCEAHGSASPLLVITGIRTDQKGRAIRERLEPLPSYGGVAVAAPPGSCATMFRLMMRRTSTWPRHSMRRFSPPTQACVPCRTREPSSGSSEVRSAPCGRGRPIDFYKKYGFISVDLAERQSDARPSPIPMFLAIRTIRKALDGEDT